MIRWCLFRLIYYNRFFIMNKPLFYKLRTWSRKVKYLHLSLRILLGVKLEFFKNRPQFFKILQTCCKIHVIFLKICQITSGIFAICKKKKIYFLYIFFKICLAKSHFFSCNKITLNKPNGCLLNTPLNQRHFNKNITN